MAKRKEFRRPLIAIYSLYGPNDRVASKAVVAIMREGSDEIIELRRWMSGKTDVREEEKIQKQIGDVLRGYGIKRLVTAGRIIGCPHEEGLDYSESEDCPFCPYWAGRDRWTGEMKK